MVRRLSICLLAAAAFVSAATAQVRFPKEPPITKPIYDGANLIDPADEQQIVYASYQCYQETGGPIYVVTIPSLRSMGARGLSIEQYATKLYNKWAIGDARTNNGVLILVAKADRKARIELGGGWSDQFDVQALQVMDTRIIPHFRNGNFSQGILNGTLAMREVAVGSFVPPPKAVSVNMEPPGKRPFIETSQIFPLAVGGVFLVLFMIAMYQAARDSRRVGQQMRNDPTDPRHDPNWGARSGDDDDSPWWGGGSSSGGGFSSGGGGGSSSGGGASGSW